ncbi:hypothetical protein PAL_GLEAN10024561 [Pteropus alecto]|uniref:Uncharacterized protein n=1 Tax=Pteropus alecto TaxID=9402 RepID=L5JXZ2_PTEAL|nr:hypothetical protein PAL_GLEAN10024561 [Pteropus alecto]
MGTEARFLDQGLVPGHTARTSRAGTELGARKSFPWALLGEPGPAHPPTGYGDPFLPMLDKLLLPVAFSPRTWPGDTSKKVSVWRKGQKRTPRKSPRTKQQRAPKLALPSRWSSGAVTKRRLRNPAAQAQIELSSWPSDLRGQPAGALAQPPCAAGCA